MEAEKAYQNKLLPKLEETQRATEKVLRLQAELKSYYEAIASIEDALGHSSTNPHASRIDDSLQTAVEELGAASPKVFKDYYDLNSQAHEEFKQDGRVSDETKEKIKEMEQNYPEIEAMNQAGILWQITSDDPALLNKPRDENKVIQAVSDFNSVFDKAQKFKLPDGSTFIPLSSEHAEKNLQLLKTEVKKLEIKSGEAIDKQVKAKQELTALSTEMKSFEK